MLLKQVMKTEKSSKEFADELKASVKGQARTQEVVGAGVGALAGAGLGAVGGPPGAIVGALVGGVAGALASLALEASSAGEAAHQADLDEEIGVVGGDLGAPGLEHPPSKSGAFSSAAMGAGTATGSDDQASAEGPIPPAD